MYAGNRYAQNPDRAAFIMAGSGETVTYAEHERRTNRLAQLLRAEGLQRLDHFAIFMENNSRYLECNGAGERSGLYYTCINSYLTPDELARRPAHMRKPRECVSEVLSYDLRAAVDGRVVAEKLVRSPGLRADRPLNVEEDLRIAPGDHEVSVTFTPHAGAAAGKALSLERKLRFDRGRVVLITTENDTLIAK